MADHDRDAGSRGEEEAPRDPTPSELKEPGPLKYGEQADRPYTYLPPTQPLPTPGERASTPFGDFLRRRRTQITGAGLIGLLVGGILGGVTVAAFNDLREDHGRFDMRTEAPGWSHHRKWGPELRMPCYEVDNRGLCVLPPPAEMMPGDPPENVDPGPVYTG